ncbi:ribonuclease H-like domain-containing protein [Tanacetum coccineum]
MPPKPNLSFSGLEEFVNEPIVSKPTVKKPVVETSEAKASADKPKAVKKNNGAPIIEDWVSDSEKEYMPQTKIQMKIVKPTFTKIEFVKSKEQGNPQMELQDQGVIDSGCSRHMTWNMSYLTDFEEINGGYVAFGELQFNLFSVSQMCDKKNSVLFNDTECIVLSPNFKLTDESHVLLKVPRKNNMYSVDLKNIVPKGGLTCLFTKSTFDESKLWHRRLGNINLKTMNKLVKGNLVRGLPLKLFEDNQTCVACQKEKQHRASGYGRTRKEGGDSSNDQEKEDDNVNITNNVNTASDGNNTNNVNAVSLTVNAAGIKVNAVGAKTSIELPNDPNMLELEDIVFRSTMKCWCLQKAMA